MTKVIHRATAKHRHGDGVGDLVGSGRLHKRSLKRKSNNQGVHLNRRKIKRVKPMSAGRNMY